ncbi:MAG: hypothetical protein KatS3mg114_1305 [Planctomycetaceae bacterium]|nr:MAG: hypothetical protein KatS3mg114_1305 [Planctomycetaceae bacterium]
MSHDVVYTALARRFRPQTFEEVVGQTRIAQTLRNAILEGRVAHAYLFTGARGVGKTSMARIFAKALNCPHSQQAHPCNTCEICRSIAAGQDVDVAEIDGASNRGIDDIRQLRANVGLRPLRCRYKIYIVDEVHMLTREAFNALLKTLEEPPENVKFIFCTTEPQKLPETILSRCQRFDFGMIALEDIVRRLQQLAEAEGFQVEPEALALVARRAQGSMRDSQSLFDQLLAFGAQRITVEDVLRLLGLAPEERLIELGRLLLERQSAAVLHTWHQALQQGVQLEAFFDQLLAYFRDLLVLAAGAQQLPLSSVGEGWRDELVRQAHAWGLHTLVAAIEILAETRQRLQRSTVAATLTELALVRLCLLGDLERLAAVIDRLQGNHSRGPGEEAGPPVGRGQGIPPSKPRMAPSPSVGPQVAPGHRGAAPTTPASPPEASSIPPEPPPASLHLTPADLPALLKQLQARFTDMTGSYLNSVESLAISGPNHLELCVPAQYDLARKALEKPEVLVRVEAAVKELVGTSVRLTLRTVPRSPSSGSPAVPPTARPLAPARRPAIDSKQVTEPLVQQAAKVFGIEQWKVLDRSLRRPQKTSEPPQS